MNDQSTPVAADDIFTGGTNYSPPSYALDEAEQAIADEILAIDPFSDIAPSGNISDSIRVPSSIPYSALSPQDRAAVDHELRGVPQARRHEVEGQAIASLMVAKSRQARVKTGLGEGATPYHHELREIAGQVEQFSREFDKLSADRVRVSHYETDELGKPVPKYALGAAAQAAAVARQNELHYHIRLLIAEDGNHGPEAERRLAAATKDSVAQYQAHARQVAIHREAEVQSEQINFDAEVKARAEMLAKSKRNTL